MPLCYNLFKAKERHIWRISRNTMNCGTHSCTRKLNIMYNHCWHPRTRVTNNKEHVVEHVNDHDGNQNTNSKDHEDEIPLIMNRNKRKKKILRDEDTSSEEQWDDDSDDTDDIVTGFEEFE
eukprot:1045118_1